MAQITILDGGMGQELIHRHGKPASPLWSTGVMMDRPGLVSEVHQDFAKAGARVATTNTYSIHRARLRGNAGNHYASDDVVLPDLEDQFEALLQAALDEVDAVRDTCRIAAGIGPLGASYRADLHPDCATATPLYAEIATILAPSVDILLFETIPSIDAGRACLAAGRHVDRDVWLAFSVDDTDGTRLRSGEPVSEAAALGAEADAVLINCSSPEAIPAALEPLAKAGTPFGAYANGFTQLADAFVQGGATADVLSARKDLTPEAYADHVVAWASMGATIVGGCCEISPAHIAEMVRRLTAEGYDLAP